ncbi:hypothetical protein [Endozoicomonas sp.]|uniref:hypothetical protein n=1 Tax=Endozoicomonas TaxID=305899 RepID=UPI003AF63AB1
MMSIEKYTQKDGQTGWLAHISQKKRNRKSCALTRRFSSAQYGDAAFQKALAWAEDHQDERAHS